MSADNTDNLIKKILSSSIKECINTKPKLKASDI